jgi:ankyrin repeat protein
MIEKVGISPNATDYRGNTCMHDAAYQDVSKDLLIYLLSAGGDPNKPNRFGETAVFEASYRARPSLMKVLLEHNGNPNPQTVSVILQFRCYVTHFLLLLLN